MKARLLNWLLYDFVIKTIDLELRYDITFIVRDEKFHSSSMAVIPQIGSKVEVKEKWFLVQDILYSPSGVSNKIFGIFIDHF